MKKLILGLLIFVTIVFIAFISLSQGDLIDVDDFPSQYNFTQDPRMTNKNNFTGVKVSIIKTATSETKKGLIVGGESIFEPYTISHNAILITHPKGNVLFDTGLGNNIDEQFKEIPKALQGFLEYTAIKSAQTVLSQSNTDISNIIISHFHWDHVGGVKDFPNAKILVSEQDFLRAKQGKDGAVPSQISGDNIKWRFIKYTDLAYENFTRSFDLYGDGSIILVELPGHTFGSLGAFVNTEKGQRYFFTGDVTYSLLGFTKPAEKSFLLKNVLDIDNQALVLTILKVHYLMKQYPDLIVVPAHDAELQSTLPQFTSDGD